MNVLCLVVALTCPAPPEAPICMAQRIAGTGLKDGRGIVHMMFAGTYVFTNGVVNRKKGPQIFLQGDYGTVYSTTGPLEWTRPDGVHEVVPTEFLYPPGGISPPTY